LSHAATEMLCTVAAPPSNEIEDLREEAETLQGEKSRLAACARAMYAELSAVQERRSALQRAVNAQEETYASQQQMQRRKISQRITDCKQKIGDLSVVIDADRARLDVDTRTLDGAMERIGALQGELLCVETACTTEADTLSSIMYDMESENAVSDAWRQRLEATRSEVATLRANHQSLASDSVVDFCGGSCNDDNSADSHRQRIELDVVEAMAQAIRMTSGETPGDGMAMLGTPQFARQLLVAQGLLEDIHQRELQAIRDQGIAWRRSLEEQAAEQQNRRAILEELAKNELSSMSLNRGQLARRACTGEFEHDHVEPNSEQEIARTKSNDNRLGSDSEAEPAVATISSGVEDVASSDGSTLARMNASLRDTHRSLVRQQEKLEDVTRERDRLQAHLLVALERASNHGHGLRSPSATITQSDGDSHGEPIPATA